MGCGSSVVVRFHRTPLGSSLACAVVSCSGSADKTDEASVLADIAPALADTTALPAGAARAAEAKAMAQNTDAMSLLMTMAEPVRA